MQECIVVGIWKHGDRARSWLSCGPEYVPPFQTACFLIHSEESFLELPWCFVLIERKKTPTSDALLAGFVSLRSCDAAKYSFESY